MVERLKAAYGLEQFPETGVKYQVRFSIFKDEAAICLDTSGEGLYKRGYRAVGVEAPLRETLAAALVTLSRYRGRDPFCDPFCGSGTIPIEAALIAKNRAPGLYRDFSAMKWPVFDKKVWDDARAEAVSKEYSGDYRIVGADIDPEAVRVSRGNAEANGLGGRVAFREAGLDGGLKSGPWDLVLANILANILCANAEVLLRATAPGGTLALSGILEREAAQAAAHFQSAADRLGMAVEMRTLVLGEWAGIHIERY